MCASKTFSGHFRSVNQDDFFGTMCTQLSVLDKEKIKLTNQKPEQKLTKRFVKELVIVLNLIREL